MCTTCGCGHGEAKVEGVPVPAADAPGAGWHRHDDGSLHADHDHDAHHGHDPAHEHKHKHEHGLGAAAGPRGAHAPGISATRAVQIEEDILAQNNVYAARNRRLFADRGVFALNLVSSPGSGKTTLLVKSIEALRGRVAVAVIEGDQQTSLDADRIRGTGAPAVQINTGKGCHLDAHMVGHALEQVQPADGSLLLIENVGNLVCPAAFDLGEAHKVVVLSVTEGEDKPVKYPDMFAAADLLLLNKSDLLPHVEFDVGRCLAHALRVNPRLQTLVVSARTGEGMPAFYAWVEGRAARHARAASNLVTAKQDR